MTREQTQLFPSHTEIAGKSQCTLVRDCHTTHRSHHCQSILSSPPSPYCATQGMFVS